MRKLPRKSNVSLSAEATAVLALLRETDAHTLNQFTTREQIRRLQDFLRPFGSGRVALASGQIEAAMELHAGQVAWMEARLGCRMPPPPTGGIEFASLADLLAFGRSLGPALGDHLARHRPLKQSNDEARTLLLRLADRLGRVPA